MINITTYTYKLDILREYMDMWIYSFGKGVWWIDIDAIPRMNPEQFLRLYAETGLIFYNGNTPPVPPRKLSFEEWLQLNTGNCYICSRILPEEVRYCEVSDCPHK